MRYALLPASLVGVALMAGCASPARMENMQISSADQAYRLAASAPQAIKNQVSVHDVTGGKETNPMWVSEVSSSSFRQALESSLRAVGLHAPGSLGDYRLVAHLETLDKPMIGLDLKVTATINYTLEHRKTGKVVFARTISTPHTATFSDAAIAVERLRMANEGAIRNNISALIGELLGLNKDNIVVSVN